MSPELDAGDRLLTNVTPLTVTNSMIEIGSDWDGIFIHVNGVEGGARLNAKCFKGIKAKEGDFTRKCPCHFAAILSAAKNLIIPVRQTLRLRLRVRFWIFM